MKKLLIAIMFLSIILVINAKMIDQKTAEEVVENWIKQQDTRFEFSDQIVKVETQRVSEIVLTYTMHLKGQGFVIVSADDNIEPILAFSAKTKFDESNMAPATRDYLKGYYDQIELIISKELINKEAQNKWSSLINNTYQNRDTDYRNYLLSTTWNQGIYYNAQCPSDTQGPDGHVYAGCVATAMSQIMKYWAHPAQGQGTHSYYWSPYGTISANFGNATYNWVAMPNNITGHNTEIAKLLFHAGVSVDMQYGPNGSGAYSSDVPLALTSHFGYNSQVMKSKSSYADTQWTTMLKSELDNNRPILYAGYGPDGGHAFVCDGYSGTNYFHFNWGWSGSADGYFYLNALNPGSYSFTNDQMAIMGIEPVEIDDPSSDIYATDLFISEYIEGSSNNKALEIFNGTGETVDLSMYKIKLAANGNVWNESNTYQMTGTLAHGGTFVICHNQSNAAIKELSDVYPNSGNPTNYNGNDCVGLFKNDVLIDIFGIYNTGNSSEPNFNVADVVGAAANHTLIRKPTVISPTTDWASSAGTDENDSEWIVYPIDYIDDLGQHTFNPQVPTAAITPTFSPGSGSYFNSVSVTIASTTPEASIYYTTDGTDPNNQSTPYTTPINITQNTNLKAIAYAEGLDPSNIANANYTIIIPIANANIAALRQQDDDESTIYKLTGEAVVTFKQTYRNQKFIQDATGGILIDDQANILGDYNLYDGITGITGKLVSFGGMLQFTPVLSGNPASSTNNEVSPTTVSANTFNNNFEDYEAQLVKIDGVQFTSTGNFANGQIYYAASGSDILKFRTTFYDVDYTGTAIPTGNLSIVGIANSTDDGNFISARNAADFTVVTTNPPTNVVAVATDTAVELTWDEPGTSVDTWFTHALT
ncbi:MAG TPA: C10 family peptidase, partial [Candidatus Cloacimonadota bacterium]|nr:C10 family peptidase [Candidatus Cloacimonadota bacterium]